MINREPVSGASTLTPRTDTSRGLFGSNTAMYFRPGFTPDEMGSTAQAVAYLASSPAARAAHI